MCPEEISPDVALDRLWGRVVKLLSFVFKDQEEHLKLEVKGSSTNPKWESMHQLGLVWSSEDHNPDGIYASF